DGSKIAFRRSRGESITDLYVVPVDGGESGVRRITFDKRNLDGHTWAADGASLIFASRRRSSMGILWRVPLAGGGPEMIPASMGQGAMWPSAARKGRGIVWATQVVDINIWRVPT